ncbi:unnamed protein product [Knipowitschia caucasica]
MTASVPARASGVIYSCVNMAASVASQVAARRLRTAASKPALLDKLKSTWLSPRRWLNLQEYQSKKLMQDSGVTVQRFYVADTASEALEAAKRLMSSRLQSRRADRVLVGCQPVRCHSGGCGWTVPAGSVFHGPDYNEDGIYLLSAVKAACQGQKPLLESGP